MQHTVVVEVLEAPADVDDVAEQLLLRDGRLVHCVGGDDVPEVASLRMLHDDEQPVVLAPRFHVPEHAQALLSSVLPQEMGSRGERRGVPGPFAWELHLMRFSCLSCFISLASFSVSSLSFSERPCRETAFMTKTSLVSFLFTCRWEVHWVS